MKNIALNDVIAAISTPVGSGGIGIVRISGEGAVETADKIFVSADGKKLSEKESHTITYGHIKDTKTGEIIDEVLVMLMLAPRTYTAEDTVEINCHGGMLVTNKVLETALNNGARMAEPGEFTKRAFLNGRIDLSQAEAVMDLIDSKTELSRKTALTQLEGSIKEKVHGLRDELLDMIASIEAAIDYPEHDIEEETYSQMNIKITALKEKINELPAPDSVFIGGSKGMLKDIIDQLIRKNPSVHIVMTAVTMETLNEALEYLEINFQKVETVCIAVTNVVKRGRYHMPDVQNPIFIIDAR